MTLDRRDFAKLMAGGALGSFVIPSSLRAALGGPLRLRGQEPFFQWTAVAPGVHVATGQGGNVMVVANGGEALISDSKNLGYGFTLRREAEAVGGAPLRHAVNTHHHGDHVGGNVAFTTDLPLIGHPNAQARLGEWAQGVVGQENERLARTASQMREQGGDPQVIEEIERLVSELRSMSPDRFVPNQTVSDTEEVSVGGRAVQLRHADRGHTDNDLFLYVPQVNLIHTGDLLFVGRHPFIDAPGGATTAGWQRCLEAMMRFADGGTVVIPGHGEITDRAGLQRQWDYFEGMRASVTAAVAEGRTREEVMALTPSVFEGLGDGARNLGVVYDEVTAG